jgi:hypothetical protein
LGDVEIGGWVRTRNSPPEGELVEKECAMGNAFVIYLAGIAPKAKIGKAEIKDKKDGIYQVELVVENQGLIPTATQQAEALGLGEPLLLEVSPDDNLEILFGETRAKLPRIRGHSESDKISYLVRVKSASKKAVLKVSVKSQKAGQDIQEIEIK